jgi:hypothetical protein
MTETDIRCKRRSHLEEQPNVAKRGATLVAEVARLPPDDAEGNRDDTIRKRPTDSSRRIALKQRKQS